jgi:hypothetical protein
MLLAFALGLLVATAGTATAARLITGSQIKDGSIAKRDLSSAIQARLARGARPGATGARGPAGATGPAGRPGRDGASGRDGAAGTALAYAHVTRTGAVDAALSKNVPTGNVHFGATNSGIYCFSGLGFAPRNAIATLGADGGGIGITSAIGPRLGCPAATQITVATYSEKAFLDDEFSLLVN